MENIVWVALIAGALGITIWFASNSGGGDNSHLGDGE